MKSKKRESETYTDEELEWQIKHGIIYSDSPRFVKETVKEKQREIESKISSPEEEMDAFMKEHGGTTRFLSARKEDDFFERQEGEERIGWIKRILNFFRR